MLIALPLIWDMRSVLREFAKTILGAAPIFCGIALVEDQHHQTAVIEVIRPENIVREEDRLFRRRSRCWRVCHLTRLIC